jgi:hypothetical protein
VPFLIFTNKSEKLGEKPDIEMIVNELGLHKINNHQWYFQMGSVLENKGIDEAMDWISD